MMNRSATVDIVPLLARTAASVGLGFVVGALPSADIASRFAATDNDAVIDLRATGSANPGAMNAGKELGKKWGAAVLAADVAKGAAAAVIGRFLAGPLGANLASTAAVAGHCYPPGRTGGKGVSTSIGQVIGTFPYYLPLDIAVGLATAALPKWTQRTWAATATASTVWVATSTLAVRRSWPTGIDRVASPSLPISAALTSVIIAKRFLDTPLTDGKPVDKDDRS